MRNRKKVNDFPAYIWANKARKQFIFETRLEKNCSCYLLSVFQGKYIINSIGYPNLDYFLKLGFELIDKSKDLYLFKKAITAAAAGR